MHLARKLREWGGGRGESEKFCLWNPEHKALESVIQLKESEIPKTMMVIQNPSLALTRLEASTWNPESTCKTQPDYSTFCY